MSEDNAFDFVVPLPVGIYTHTTYIERKEGRRGPTVGIEYVKSFGNFDGDVTSSDSDSSLSLLAIALASVLSSSSCGVNKSSYTRAPWSRQTPNGFPFTARA